MSSTTTTLKLNFARAEKLDRYISETRVTSPDGFSAEIVCERDDTGWGDSPKVAFYEVRMLVDWPAAVDFDDATFFVGSDCPARSALKQAKDFVREAYQSWQQRAKEHTKSTTTTSSTHDFGSGPVPAHQHPNGGGWVADTATVAPTAYVGPTATVCGNAVVSDNAVVSGSAMAH